MSDAAASYFFAVRMCRLKGLITGEFWPHEEDTFDLVMASAMTRENVVSTTILCDKSGEPRRRYQRLSPALSPAAFKGATADE